MKHVHAEFIKLFVDGVNIERCYGGNKWFLVTDVAEFNRVVATFRVKPEVKPDVVAYACLDYEYGQIGAYLYTSAPYPNNTLKITFDGGTGKLIAAEVLE